MDTASNPELVRTASMPGPALPASARDILEAEDGSRVEIATSAAERALRPGLG